MDGPMRLVDELLRASSKHDRRGPAPRASSEEVVAFVANLALLEVLAVAEGGGLDVVACALHDPARRLCHPHHVLVCDPAGAEKIPVGKVLRGEVADGKLGQDDLGARSHASLELVINNPPLGVHDGLVLIGVGDADLRILLLGLELELDVEEQNVRVAELLRLLLEAGVAEGLLEGNALDEEGLAHGSPGDLLDADKVQVQQLRIEHGHCVHDHRREHVLVVADELGVERSSRAGHKQLPRLIAAPHADREVLDALHGEIRRLPNAPDDDLRMQAVLHEGLHLVEDRGRNEHDRGRAVSHLGILRHADVHEGLGSRVHHVQKPHDGRSVVADGDFAAVEDELVHAARAESGLDGLCDRRTCVDVADDLGLALRGIRALPEQDDAWLHHHRHFVEWPGFGRPQKSSGGCPSRGVSRTVALWR
mmetsp:Transcript_8737/g.32936  ORF Transcript_8737/g.32936 Transcript_8737/m.32936 type:complete len:422 (-) Transcript_8737:9-1274(-)